jgi:hypothetical protein
MERPRVADGGDGFQIIWRGAVNILNKYSRKTDKWWSSSLGVGGEVNNSSPSKISLLRNVSRMKREYAHFPNEILNP